MRLMENNLMICSDEKFLTLHMGASQMVEVCNSKEELNNVTDQLTSDVINLCKGKDDFINRLIVDKTYYFPTSYWVEFDEDIIWVYPKVDGVILDTSHPYKFKLNEKFDLRNLIAARKIDFSIEMSKKSIDEQIQYLSSRLFNDRDMSENEIDKKHLLIGKLTESKYRLSSYLNSSEFEESIYDKYISCPEEKFIELRYKLSRKSNK